MENQRYFFYKITDKDGFRDYEMDVKLDLLELYYSLTKSLIQIVAIAWPHDIKNTLKDLKADH